MEPSLIEPLIVNGGALPTKERLDRIEVKLDKLSDKLDEIRVHGTDQARLAVQQTLQLETRLDALEAHHATAVTAAHQWTVFWRIIVTTLTLIALFLAGFGPFIFHVH